MSHEFEAMLAESLEDHRLSRRERQDIAARAASLTVEQRQALLRRAVETAKSTLGATADPLILDWVVDVARALSRDADNHEQSPTPTAEAFFGPGDDCPRKLIQLFKNARGKVDVCVFTITDDRITSAILEAHQRGVALRVITDNDKAGDLGSDIERLESEGVSVRVDRSEHHMHHKFALFDNCLLVTGSFNWTRGASEYNDENLIVVSDDRLVGPFARTFERIWQRLS